MRMNSRSVIATAALPVRNSRRSWSIVFLWVLALSSMAPAWAESGEPAPLSSNTPPAGTSWGSVLAADELLATEVTRIYADPGSTVSVLVDRDDDAGDADVDVSLSGHLVDVP